MALRAGIFISSIDIESPANRVFRRGALVFAAIVGFLVIGTKRQVEQQAAASLGETNFRRGPIDQLLRTISQSLISSKQLIEVVPNLRALPSVS